MPTLFEGYITGLPPSVNKMYTQTRRGPVLSKELKQFKARAKLEVLGQLGLDYKGGDPAQAYKLDLVFHLPILVNKGWPKKTKNRFRKKDVSNYIKVVEDVLADALSVDDSCFLAVHAVKTEPRPRDGFVGVSIRLEEYEHGEID